MQREALFLSAARPSFLDPATAQTTSTKLRNTLHYCRIDGGNFGDDLNLVLWKRLFPNFQELAGHVQFYGVGTLLDGPQDRSVRKVVLGTGIGELNQAARNGNWDFRWVRGPQTAREFGLSTDLGLGDAAILWPELRSGHNTRGPVGLVPHYMTYDSFDWCLVAQQADMVLINPRQSPSAVIRQMRGCSRILAESLHGGICADAMGIPWAACVLAHRFNEFKWRDWLATIGRAYEPFVTDRPLVRSISTGKSWANQMARLVSYRASTRHPALRPVAPATPWDVQRVAQTLHDYACNEDHFQCSTAATIAAQRYRMQACCAAFARDYGLQFSPAW